MSGQTPSGSGEDDIAITIRPAIDADAVAISALVSRLTTAHILPGQLPGAEEKLLSWMAPDAIARRIAGGHRYHLAECGPVLAGVVAIRDNAHLYLLFVDTPFQRRGIARRLWQTALPACVAASDSERITVNASAYAVEA